MLYIVGEGTGGLGQRVAAWLDAHPDADIDDLTFHNGAAMLTDGRVLAELVGIVGELQPVLIVVDTLARCAPGAEESTPAMNEMVAACDVLRHVCGSTVLIVHHEGKDPARGARGPMALLAAVDTSIKLGVDVTLRCEAQRDAEPFEPIGVQLEPHLASVVAISGSTAGVSMSEGAAQILAVLRNSDDGTGLTSSAWLRSCGDVAEATFYRHRKVLVNGHHVRREGDGRGARYRIVEGSGE